MPTLAIVAIGLAAWPVFTAFIALLEQDWSFSDWKRLTLFPFELLIGVLITPSRRW